ncbi:MAG: hypothetical protein RMJ82_15500 [Gemmatales bacterium]|nr:hypothetical protein [Gemmatales bacterium]
MQEQFAWLASLGEKETGGPRWIPLSPYRKLVIEMLHHARKVPSIPVARRMNLSYLVQARQWCHHKPSWTALFIRAYGLVAVDLPELRRAYMPLPWPHLYEHPFSIASVAVERRIDNEAVLLAAKIHTPERCSLGDIQSHLERFKHAPLEDISDYRQLRRLGRMPGWLRRFFFWQTLTWSGYKRAKRFGTFMVSSYGSLGAEQLHPICPLTTLLTFGPISPDGEVVVKIIYDHRVLDGRRVAAALARLEEMLNTAVRAELEMLCRAA